MKQLSIIIFFMAFIFSNKTFADNLHLIEEDLETGFAIYRSGAPDITELQELCLKGVEEIVVLSGNAEEHEEKFKTVCPKLRVVYNKRQTTRTPVDENFLSFFDSWVEDAKAKGKKIAFRCNCGCHRTGRLAAYYQMKYQKITASDALELMKTRGKFMFMFPHLIPQVYALEDYIHERPCSVEKKYCVRP